MPDPTYSNPTDAATIISNAQAKAQQAYNNSRLQLDSDTLAFNKAQAAFNNEITKAGLTGQYQGDWTQPALTNFANLFGTWGAPQQGQQTLAGQQQGFTQQQQLAQMYGQYYAPGQAPTAGQTTQAAQQQAFGQWQAAQQLALQQQQQQQQGAQQYLSMMAGLRGPADWIQYQKVLGAAPGGLQQLAAAAAGQYVPGGGATTGVQPQAVTLPGFVNSATAGQFGGQQTQQYQAYGQQQAQPGQMQYDIYNQLQGGRMQGGGAGNPNQVFTQQGQQYDQSQQPMGSNAQQTQAFQNALVAPNQMAPQTWANLTPSQQQMLLGTWESQGYTQDDAKALFSQSLPKYATSSAGAGSFKLQ